METAIKTIRNKGLKATAQRVAVYRALAELGHATVEQVAERVVRTAPSVSVATVYNVLDCMAQVDLVARLSTPSGKLYYDTTPAAHHHLFYPDGSVCDYPDQGLSQLIADHLAAHPVPGVEIDRINLLLFSK